MKLDEKVVRKVGAFKYLRAHIISFTIQTDRKISTTNEMEEV